MHDDPNEIAEYLIQAYGGKEAALEAAIKGTARAQELQDMYSVSVWREVKNILRKAAAAALFALLVVPPVFAQNAGTLSGTVTHVRDGDTIEVDGVPVRLQGLSAPERYQPFGEDATAYMQWLVLDKEVRCELTGERNRDRLIGICYYRGIDIARLIIREGLALDCPKFSKGRYAQDEATAKDTGIRERYVLPDYCGTAS